jgi:opacity protein-like surface antigen
MTQMTQIYRAPRALIARVLAVAVLLIGPGALAAFAQQPPPAPRSRAIEIGGFAMFGQINFAASESFDAIIGDPAGPLLGGGAHIGLPFGGLFVEVGGWKFNDDGERAFVSNGQVVSLGIPVDITITPIEITGGWRFRFTTLPRLLPYAGGGFSSYGYKETSQFATTTEDVEDRFNGYHLLGGAEVKLLRWLGVAGEEAWTTIPDAIGEAGVSAAFNETDLGGTSFRLKITVGR